MKSTRPGHGHAARAVVACLVATSSILASAPEARADEVSPKGKGIVGGALLGGEVVMITESLIGVRSGWAHAIGGILGAAGGGVGGYFIENASFSSDGRIPMYMLAGGLGLIIPTAILSLNATRFQPDAEATEDHAPTNVPAADPGRQGGTSVVGAPPAAPAPASSGPSPAPAGTPPANPPAGGTPPTTTPPPTSPQAPPPMSLLDMHEGEIRIGVPVPEVRSMYSLREMKQFGVPQGTEVRMPVVHVTF